MLKLIDGNFGYAGKMKQERSKNDIGYKKGNKPTARILCVPGFSSFEITKERRGNRKHLVKRVVNRRKGFAISYENSVW